METLNILFELTVYSAVIYTATMLLKLCFKNKMSPFLHYAIWFVLVLRLLMPVTFASPVRLFVIPAETQNTAAQQIQPQAYEPVSMPGISETEPAEAQLQTGAEAHALGEAQAAPVTFHRLNLPLPQIITFIWLAGVGVCLWYLAVLYASLRRKFCSNSARPSKALMALFEETKAELGIKANIKLVCQYEYGTPSLMFPKTIMMPADALVAMDEEQTKFALRHELTHYKRRDHVMSILLLLMNAVYWFNPFVWLAFRQMRADMETACDSAVVKALTSTAKSRYAKLILTLSSQPVHRQLVLGMSHSNARKAAEQRVKGIFMRGESRMSVKLISVLLAVTLIFTCFTTACQPALVNNAAVNNDQVVSEENINDELSAAPSPYISENTYSINSRIIPCDFTQSEVDAVIAYFFNDSPLYAEEYKKSKSMIEAELAQIRADREKMDGSNPDDIEGAEYAIKKLEEAYPSAPETVVRTQITSKLTVPSDVDYEALNAIADLGYTELSSISVSNRPEFQFMSVVLDKSRYFLPNLLPAGNNTDGREMTPDEAKQKAEDVLNDLRIENMTAVRVEAGMTEDRSKQGYVVTFHRSVNGTPVTYYEREAMYEKWPGDKLQIRLDEKGISGFQWMYKGTFQE